MKIRIAPGQPGIPPTWTSSAKSGVGTAAGMQSRVWFTISHGILNEIYFPFVDRFTSSYKGIPMLFAQRGTTTAALACSSAFKAMSCGYVG